MTTSRTDDDDDDVATAVAASAAAAGLPTPGSAIAPGSDANDSKEQQMQIHQQNNLHRQTEAQLEAISRDVKESQVLTSVLIPLEALKAEYTIRNGGNGKGNDDGNDNGNDVNRFFLLGIDSLLLNGGHTHYRSTRGDGNCYYRAVLYQMCDRLLLPVKPVDGGGGVVNNNVVDEQDDSAAWTRNEARRLYHWLRDESLAWVTTVGGYDEGAVEDFCDCLVDLIGRIVATNDVVGFVGNGVGAGKDRGGSGNSNGNNNGDGSTGNTGDGNNGNNSNNPKPLEGGHATLHTLLNDEVESSTSDCCVWYLRVLAATFCKADPDRFLPYVLAGDDEGQGQGHATTTTFFDVPSYCRARIEPVGCDATMVSALALAEALHVKVSVAYLDGHAFGSSTSSAGAGTTLGTGTTVTTHVFGPQNDDDDGNSNKRRLLHLTLLYRPGHYDILY